MREETKGTHPASSSSDLCLVIDDDVIARYEEYYFREHPRASVKPIKQPYHESMNVWMILKRPMMNALKQKWKSFIAWFVEDQGYANLLIEKCEIRFDTYYATDRRHDTDNSCPKFIIDGLVDGGLIVDDDSKHIEKLTLCCYTDRERPRTEIHIMIHDA